MAWADRIIRIGRVREVDVPDGIAGRIELTPLVYPAVDLVLTEHRMCAHGVRIGTPNPGRLLSLQDWQAVRIA